jgi:hypothetical protein
MAKKVYSTVLRYQSKEQRNALKKTAKHIGKSVNAILNELITNFNLKQEAKNIE